MRQAQRIVRLSSVALACSALFAGCGGGGGDNAGGRLQTIAFAFPGAATLGIGAVALDATATSGLPVTFASGTPDVCSVSGSTVTPLKEAQCVIIASQPGGSSADGTQWAAADSVNQVFNVLKGTQTVEFALPAYLLSTDSLRVPLTAKAKNSLGADNGMPIEFAVSTPTVCAIEGSELVLSGKGICAVDAVQPGNETYKRAVKSLIVAVDPVIIADGFDVATLGSGHGTNTSIRTLQGGGVSVNAWHWSIGQAAIGDGGWENCDSRLGDWCYQEIPADGSMLTSALQTKQDVNQGWDNGAAFNRVDIFVPGVTSLAWGADTAGGKQVTTEETLIFNAGVSDGVVQAGKPLVVEIVLSKNGGDDCNVTLSTVVFPSVEGMLTYGVPLSNFATTRACGTGAAEASLNDHVRQLPSYVADDPANADAALAAFMAALDQEPLRAARTSATNLIKTYPTVQVRIRNYDLQFSTTSRNANGDIVYNNDLSVGGFISML